MTVCKKLIPWEWRKIPKGKLKCSSSRQSTMLSFNITRGKETAWWHKIKGNTNWTTLFTVGKLHIQCIFVLSLLTVSAAVRLIPSPPALVLSRNTKMSFLQKREGYFKRKNWNEKVTCGNREGSLDTEQCLRPRKSSGGYPDLVHVSLTHCTKVPCC